MLLYTMKAILNFCGWIKKDDVDDVAIRRGWVRIAFCPPMEVLARNGDIKCNESFTTVDLYHVGYSNNLPVFEYEP